MIFQYSRILHGVFLAAMLSCAPLAGQAQNAFNLNDLGEGQLLLNLSATEQVSVEQDTLNISMQYAAQGRDSADLQNEVNQAIREARDILESTDNIDYAIQRYNVYMVQEGRPTRIDLSNPVWRAQQSIQMTSMNSEALLVVTARLQAAGLIVQNMYYSLSSARHQEVADSLQATVLAKLQARADEVAATLNKGRAELVEVTLDGGQGFYAPRFAMAEARTMDSGAMAVPVAEPGETQVNMTVSARALLSP